MDRRRFLLTSLAGALAAPLAGGAQPTPRVGMLIPIPRADAEAPAAAVPRFDEGHYSTLFESIDQGFCTIEVLFDTNGKACDYRFLEVNPAFERQTGLRDAVGRRMASEGGQQTTLDIEIVGLMKDAKYSEVKAATPPLFLRPYRQDETVGSMTTDNE